MDLDLLFIENVGNLICPAEFDLGEHAKVVLMSVTEGEEKPLKYPLIFHLSSAAVLTKIDLIPHLRFDLAADRKEHPQGQSPGEDHPDLHLHPRQACRRGWTGWEHRKPWHDPITRSAVIIMDAKGHPC